MNVSNRADLLAFTRHESCSKINEDSLFCQSLSIHDNKEAIFNISYVSTSGNKISSSKCLMSVTMGPYNTRKVQSTYLSCHRMKTQMNVFYIYIEYLATRKMPEKLKIMLNKSIKVVNFIEALPVNTCIFNVLCE
jgi:hypothetical protein